MKKNLNVLLVIVSILLVGCGGKGAVDPKTDPFAVGNVYEMYYVEDKDPTYQLTFLEDQRVSLDELKNRKPINFDYSLKEDEKNKVKILIFDDPYYIDTGVFSKKNPYYYTVKEDTIYLVSKDSYFGDKDPTDEKMNKLSDPDTIIKEASHIFKLKK